MTENSETELSQAEFNRRLQDLQAAFPEGEVRHRIRRDRNHPEKMTKAEWYYVWDGSECELGTINNPFQPNATYDFPENLYVVALARASLRFV